MALATSSPSTQRQVSFSWHTQAPSRGSCTTHLILEYRLLTMIMAPMPYTVVERESYSDLTCEKCSSNEGEKRGRTFSQKKLINFFWIRRSYGDVDDRLSSQDATKRQKCSAPLVLHKEKRGLLPFVPTKDPAQKLKQMGFLTSALTTLNMEFSDHLTCLPGMAPRSANQAVLENGGMQILSKEEMETFEHFNAMPKRCEFPPIYGCL
ncbi:Histone-lysine N-methyltransferase ATXR5 [Spatholobus suberectus]|nr:Histone-lysine N-methyltransferase ATXR5 [Spatholobus suberectus]